MASNLIKFSDVRDKVVRLREQDVLLDFSVAELYGVETRIVNQAVKNNPDKFPSGYVFEVSRKEFSDLRSKFLMTNETTFSKSRVLPKAFTEKGLYMLATILKSERATRTTIAIIEAFAKLRELSRTIGEMSANPDEFEQKSLMQKSGEIMADLFGEDMQTTDTETEIELNFAVLKLKHTIKRKK
ncbi:MAG: ORF6N domain-containing protein [Lachnospiraceae bacterium]|nr:ORF6N domain-containing protein [Lachnospiraceae bacterium]